MNYADLKWSIIQEWNSDGKYTNEYLIEIGAEAGVVIKNTHADRKSIVAKISDEMITAGVESGEYVVDGMGEDCDNDINFKRYMGDLTIPAPTLKLEDSPMLTFEEMGMSVDEHEHEDGTVHSHPHEGEHSHDEEKYSYEDEEEEELPDFKKMTKLALDEWALDRGIELDRRQTKAHMITDLEEHLEV
tara:strand:+ start:1306 stop:1869 length:564 start_codon:yes stop_codon:yes gene_type:complete